MTGQYRIDIEQQYTRDLKAEIRLCPHADESRLLFKKILTFIINSCLRSSKLISCRLHFPITRQIQDKKECLVCWADGGNSPIQNI